MLRGEIRNNILHLEQKVKGKVPGKAESGNEEVKDSGRAGTHGSAGKETPPTPPFVFDEMGGRMKTPPTPP